MRTRLLFEDREYDRRQGHREELAGLRHRVHPQFLVEVDLVPARVEGLGGPRCGRRPGQAPRGCRSRYRPQVRCGERIVGDYRGPSNLEIRNRPLESIARVARLRTHGPIVEMRPDGSEAIVLDSPLEVMGRNITAEL
jgi:hypothetical protein